MGAARLVRFKDTEKWIDYAKGVEAKGGLCEATKEEKEVDKKQDE